MLNPPEPATPLKTMVAALDVVSPQSIVAVYSGFGSDAPSVPLGFPASVNVATVVGPKAAPSFGLMLTAVIALIWTSFTLIVATAVGPTAAFVSWVTVIAMVEGEPSSST